MSLPGRQYYELLAREAGLPLESAEFAALLDKRDPLAHFRSEFRIPKVRAVAGENPAAGVSPDDDCIYLCGNSLGLQPVHTKKLVDEELEMWAERGVNGHFDHPLNRPWVSIDDTVIEESAKIVGANPSEVAIMNSLTANLHFLLVAFYRPSQTRFKILIEGKAFPSDYYAVESQIRFHGYDPASALIEIHPRPNEHTLRTEDILSRIEKEGDSVALILFSGVQYYTGQFFPLHQIAAAGRAKGCVVGFDLAHAVGNVPLRLHDWDVDFACWCTYKYLNAGPGGIGGAFVHERHAKTDLQRFAGWWGTDPATKFDMANIFHPIPGAASFRVSNPNVLATVSLLGSLQVFSKTSTEDLRAKSVLLTGYLETLLDGITPKAFTILTPRDPAERGCQLSLLFEGGIMMDVFEDLKNAGVVCDERKPDVIRVAPVPLYSRFGDVHQFVRVLRASVERCAKDGQAS
ncbi:hypothetical protein HK104_003781 [Borealophlyctis nickersoniae]|nr:hypothetical protein HK104_003781 [Borealophlyctis nickersoniae]